MAASACMRGSAPGRSSQTAPQRCKPRSAGKLSAKAGQASRAALSTRYSSAAASNAGANIPAATPEAFAAGAAGSASVTRAPARASWTATAEPNAPAPAITTRIEERRRIGAEPSVGDQAAVKPRGRAPRSEGFRPSGIAGAPPAGRERSRRAKVLKRQDFDLTFASAVRVHHQIWHIRGLRQVSDNLAANMHETVQVG